MNNFLEANRNIFRFIFGLIFLIVLLAPGYVFFSNRGGLSLLEGVEDPKTISYLLFPFFGLYAFSLLWIQFMIGSNMSLLVRIFRSVRNYHKSQGKVVFLFAVLHPVLLIFSIGFSDYLGIRFVDPTLRIYALFGIIAYYLLFLTVITAILMRLSFLRRAWRIIHYLNYLIFVLVWLHSWNLGSDIQSTNLKYLWIFYGTTAVLSIAFRLLRAFNKPSPQVQTAETN